MRPAEPRLPPEETRARWPKSADGPSPMPRMPYPGDQDAGSRDRGRTANGSRRCSSAKIESEKIAQSFPVAQSRPTGRTVGARHVGVRYIGSWHGSRPLPARQPAGRSR